QLLPVVQEIADPIRRAHYLQRLARIARVDERTLAAAVTQLRKRRGPVAAGPGEPPSETPVTPSGRPAFGHRLEAYIVALVLRYPALAARVGELEPESFEDTEAREILRKLAELDGKSLDSGEIDNLNF